MSDRALSGLRDAIDACEQDSLLRLVVGAVAIEGVVFDIAARDVEIALVADDAVVETALPEHAVKWRIDSGVHACCVFQGRQ